MRFENHGSGGALGLQLTVRDLLATLHEPLTREAWVEVERALAMEDARVLSERFFGPPSAARAGTRAILAATSIAPAAMVARSTPAMLHAWPALWARRGRRGTLARSLGRGWPARVRTIRKPQAVWIAD